MYCVKCGTKLRDDANFCCRCGISLLDRARDCKTDAMIFVNENNSLPSCSKFNKVFPIILAIEIIIIVVQITITIMFICSLGVMEDDSVMGSDSISSVESPDSIPEQESDPADDYSSDPAGMQTTNSIPSDNAVESTSNETLPIDDLRLLRVSTKAISGTVNIRANGGDTYICTDADGEQELYYIGPKQIDIWQQEKAIDYEYVSCDFSGFPMFNKGGYGVVFNNGFFDRSIVKIDPETADIITVKDANGHQMSVSDDGYIAYYLYKTDDEAILAIEAPDGQIVSQKSFDAPFDSYAGNDYSWNDTLWDRLSTSFGDYASFASSTDDKQHMFCELYLFYKDGMIVKASDIAPEINNQHWQSSIYMTADFRNCLYSCGDAGTYYHLLDTGKTYRFSAAETLSFDNKEWRHYSELGRFYGTKVISRYEELYYEGMQGEMIYSLVDIESGKQTKGYRYMETDDGEIYLVQTEDYKWGYIDSSGNELAFYDHAGVFIGDYAPVVGDGKVYLIDRGMNKVSSDCDGDSVTTLSDELFLYTFEGETFIMTYCD